MRGAGMDLKKRNLDEIMDNVDNTQEGEIPDDAAEAVAGGQTAEEIWHRDPDQGIRKQHWGSVPEYHTGVRSNTDRNR